MNLPAQVTTSTKPRQIVAIVLSHVFVELALAQVEVTQLTSQAPSGAMGRAAKDRSVRKTLRKTEPRAVVWLKEGELAGDQELDAKQTLEAVNEEARQFGVRPGQTIAEARAVVAHLGLSVVRTPNLRAALERVAESMTRFGTTVALTLPNTVWVDVTGTTHLFGGEWPLLEEIRVVLDDIGHRARLAMADGPQLARAFAEWETRRQGRAAVVVAPEHKQACLKALPLTSLPIAGEIKVGLAKLGLLTAGDLLERDPAAVASRLGDQAGAILTLLRGVDTTPLTAHRPLELPSEVLDWDEPLSGNEPVLFALRRLTTQVAARLRGRALAAQSLELTLKHDPAIARHRGKEVLSRHVVQLVAPLARAEDLWRVLTARVLKIQVDVPNVGVGLRVLSVEETKQRQLDLAVGFSKLDAADPERLAVLFSELASDIGPENFGILRLANTHKPEKATLLCPVGGPPTQTKRNTKRRTTAGETNGQGLLASTAEQVALGDWKAPDKNAESSSDLPTRLLPTAVPVQTRFRVGELLPLGAKLYTIVRVTFQRRLEAVEWWSNEPCSRDYVRLWLSSTGGELQVLAYVDRITQTRYIQGWYD